MKNKFLLFMGVILFASCEGDGGPIINCFEFTENEKEKKVTIEATTTGTEGTKINGDANASSPGSAPLNGTFSYDSETGDLEFTVNGRKTTVTITPDGGVDFDGDGASDGKFTKVRWDQNSDNSVNIGSASGNASK